MSLSLWYSTCPQAEKERTACKAGQIHKMTTIFGQKQQPRTILSKNNCQFVNLLSFTDRNFVTNLLTCKAVTK